MQNIMTGGILVWTMGKGYGTQTQGNTDPIHREGLTYGACTETQIKMIQDGNIMWMTRDVHKDMQWIMGQVTVAIGTSFMVGKDVYRLQFLYHTMTGQQAIRTFNLIGYTSMLWKISRSMAVTFE